MTALAACVTAGFALQSCGIMASSSCAERADCPGGGLDGTASDQETAESSTPDETGTDVTTPDEAAKSDEAQADGADATLDVVESERDASVDVTIDQAAEQEAAADVVNESVADVVHDAPRADACVDVGPENCLNGVDDNCDGLIDCADRTGCSAYSCAPAVPTGWVGPALLWTGTFGATAPACPTGYVTAVNAQIGPTGTADTCGCSCTASGQACTATASLFSSMSCVNSCGSVTVSSSGACATAAGAGCGNAGSFMAPVPTPTGGSCTPQPTTAPGSTPGWSLSARVCSWNMGVDAPGGCAPGGQCVLGPPTGFGTTLCIYQPGTVTCPAAYPNSHTLFGGETDGRACSACMCGATPTDGTCGGTISIFGGSGCSTSAGTATFAFGQMACNGNSMVGATYSNVSPNPGSARASFTVSPGTCSVATPPMPTGQVTGTNPTTVCCQ